MKMDAGKALHITADPTTVSMAASIRAAAQAAPMLVLTTRALGELAHELGGMGAAAGFLLGVAEVKNRPIGVNLAAADDSSKTVFIAPRTWTDERLRGWIDGHGAELEAEFGEVTRVRAPFSTAGRQR